MLRRTASRRAAAATASGALALAGFGLVVLAPAASAATVPSTVHCVVPDVGLPMPDVDGPMDFTVEITPATAAPGSTVRAKVTLGDSPVKTPGFGAGYEVSVVSKLNLTMSGGASGPVSTLVAPSFTTITVEGESVKIPTYEADIRVPSSADGVVNFSVVDVISDTIAPVVGLTVTTCTVTSGGENVASVTVEGGTNPTDPATLVADSNMIRGVPANVSGTNWSSGTTPQAALCEKGVPEGNACSTAEVEASTLAIDASGNLSGTATATIGATVGDRFLRVSDGDHTVYAPVTVGDYTPSGPLEFTTDISSGPVGSVVTLTGKNGPASYYVYISESDKDKTDLTGFIGYAETDALGNWSTQYQITDARTAFIRADSGAVDPGEPAYAPFEVVPGVVQSVTASILPGDLAITQAGLGIDFGSTTLNGQAQELNAALNQVTVVDARSGNLGWSLTGTMTDLTTPEGGNIPAGNIAWTPACAASEGSPSAVVTGSAGPLGATAATLCSQTADDTTTGGRFTADAGLTLTTPAFVTPGAYAGTLTLSLS